MDYLSKEISVNHIIYEMLFRLFHIFDPDFILKLIQIIFKCLLELPLHVLISLLISLELLDILLPLIFLLLLEHLGFIFQKLLSLKILLELDLFFPVDFFIPIELFIIIINSLVRLHQLIYHKVIEIPFKTSNK